MKKRIGALGLAILLAGSILPTGLASAADVPYGMEYSGGADLGASNVQIQPGIVNSLTTIIGTDEEDLSDSTIEWKKGYYATKRDGDDVACRERYYFLIKKGEAFDTSKKVVIKKKGEKYTREMQIKNVTIYDPNNVMPTGNTMAVAATGALSISEMYPTNVDCINDTNRVDSTDLENSVTDGLAVYIDTVTKVYNTGTKEVPRLDNVYYKIADIDASQSYKIMNEGNELEKANMIAKNTNDLLPDSGDITLRNKYVSSGKYIYSEGFFNISDKEADVYVPVKKDAWENGLEIVYGFMNTAGSWDDYYSVQYKVEYKSDGNGVVTGIKKEDVLSGENPTGSETKPNENYKFTHWVADKDVELEDGTEIKAGTPMTPEQVKKVVVHENLVFTAYHEPVPKTPDTGNFTGGTNAIGITTSIMAVVTVAFLAWFAPKLTHKKVKFDKH